jgi:hypothetical protein
MEVTLKFEGGAVAVYQNGQRIRDGLSFDEADRLLRDLLNRDFAHPHV